MGFYSFPSRRKSGDSNVSSASSSTSSLDETLKLTMLPLAPREDNYNMSEEARRERLLAKCQRASQEPWKSAKPLPHHA